MKRRTIRRKPHRDPVTPLVYALVRSRDKGCVGFRLAATIKVEDREIVVFPGACDGPMELDHVHGRGMGRRGPSTLDNLVTLCRHHHRWKTDNARIGRLVLDQYLTVMRARRERDAEAKDEE